MSNTDARRYRQYAQSADWQIDDDRERLLNELLQHRGYDDRVSAKALSERTGINDSTVRDVIIELREEVGIPVANQGSGYFIVEDESELEDVVAYYNGEIQTKRERIETIVSNFNATQ